MLTMRHFRVFKAVAQTCNMSEAAKLLYISQPTVSQTISEIEDYYHTKLFERFSKKLHITEKGRYLLEYVTPLVNSYASVNELKLDHLEECSVKLGATHTVACCILNDILQAAQAVNPHMEFYVNMNNTAYLEQKLLKNELDFAIVEGIIKSKDIITVPIADDCLILVCGKNHPFADKAQVYLHELNEQNFILREEGSGTRTLFESSMAAKNIHYHVTWECTSMDAIKNAVIQNQGIAMISARLISEELKQNKLYIIRNSECMWRRDIYLCYHKKKELNHEFKPFVNAATSYYLEGVKCPIFDDEISCEL